MVKNCHLFEVDESLERALRKEALHGKHDLLTDMRRGHHARTVIQEMNHMNALKAAGEQVFDAKSDFKFELEGILHGNGFHEIAMQEGTYEVWDTEQSDRLDFIKRKFPENKIRHRARNATVVVAGKYSPPRL